MKTQELAQARQKANEELSALIARANEQYRKDGGDSASLLIAAGELAKTCEGIWSEQGNGETD